MNKLMRMLSRIRERRRVIQTMDHNLRDLAPQLQEPGVGLTNQYISLRLAHARYRRIKKEARHGYLS